MDSTFLDNLTFRQYFVQLRLDEPQSMHYFHGPALNGLLCKALNQSTLGENIVLFPAEVGRVAYQSGDLYNFSFTVFNDSENFGIKIRDALVARSEFLDNTEPFRRFFVNEFTEIPQSDVGEMVDSIENCDEVTLRFITPLRMDRKNPEAGKAYFDPSFFDPARFCKLLFNRLYDLSKICGAQVPDYQKPDITDIGIIEKNLIWVDAPYTSLKKTFGGIIGTVRIHLNSHDYWKKVLVLGQFTHAGNNSAKGFGKYVIDLPDFRKLLIRPALTILDRALRDDNMRAAFDEVRANRGVAGSDGVSISEFEAGLYENLKQLKTEITSGKYEPEDLSGVILPVAEKKVRALAIPAIRDRIFQRAVCQVLAPSIDQLLEDSSFAYRKGLSRESAARAIRKAYSEGYRYVLESDIESFFDSVDWKILYKKLDVLFNDDPILEIIWKWVTQSIVFKGQRIQRDRGIPQGAAISPLLANLLLDEFDEELQDRFRLIRYADDFIILCKSKEEAEAALEEVKEAIRKLELTIKPAKTQVTHFETGFQYLGYIFCRSAVIETEKKKKKNKRSTLVIPAPEAIPKNSWLTNIDFSKIKAIQPVSYGGKKEFALVDDVNQDMNPIPVYLSKSSVFARLSYQTLIVTNRDLPADPGEKIPLSQIRFIVDYGKPSITLPAVIELSRRNIPTFFCSRTGETYCFIPAFRTDFSIWQKQLAKSQDMQFVIDFAREIVRAKIHNYAVIARRRKWDEGILRQFSILEDCCESEINLNSLRGYEGKAAAIYFDAFANQLPPHWNFNHRRKHPPTDPVNVLLSFGYSVLYHHLATTLMGNNLNPGIGWYHSSNDRYLALACDLQEEFRHIVDSQVLQMISRNQVDLHDFNINQEHRYPYIMKKDLQRRYISIIESRLRIKFRHPDKESEIDLLGFFDHQANQIVNLCLGKQAKYRPYRIH